MLVISPDQFIIQNLLSLFRHHKSLLSIDNSLYFISEEGYFGQKLPIKLFDGQLLFL
jgi:hypothetical protein